MIPFAMDEVIVSQSLLADLMEGFRHASFAPSFGDVYLGILQGLESRFGQNVAHYAMVRGRMEGRPEQPLAPFAPITSERKSNNKGVMVLPAGTLPPKLRVGPVVSYVYLFWPPIRIPVRNVKERFRKQLTLAKPYQQEAQRIIAELSA